jgi:hypothetical protein
MPLSTSARMKEAIDIAHICTINIQHFQLLMY